MALMSPGLNSTTFPPSNPQTTLDGTHASSTGVVAAYIIAGFIVGCMLGTIFYCLWPSRVRRHMRARVLRERNRTDVDTTAPVLPR